MNDTTPLLPCPFCGGEAHRFTIEDDQDPNHGGDVIVCRKCEACSRVEFGEKEGLEEAWNQRAISDHAWLGQAGLYRTRLEAVQNGEQHLEPVSPEQLFQLARNHVREAGIHA
ncbi:Lar family restriction alleviation protein [Pseudomonas sp. HLMP]|uniref:Lar family restriction alleviation protein n=1 Tax=Pseudomonas sp. HLMP TaxID=3153767 RepID=UPI00396708DD